MSIPAGHLPVDNFPDTERMNMQRIYETRRDRLRDAARDTFGPKWKQRQLGERLGVDANYISRILSKPGRSGHKKIGEELARKLEDLLNKPTYWLDGIEPTPTYNLEEEARAVLYRVPLISWVQAGAWTEIIDNFEPGDADEWVDSPVYVSANSFALIVRGDSMAPEFVDGDIIIVDPHRRPENGSYIVARLDDEKESTFKQLIIDAGRYYLKPLNSRYPVLQVNGNMTVCGVVRAKTKMY